MLIKLLLRFSGEGNASPCARISDVLCFLAADARLPMPSRLTGRQSSQARIVHTTGGTYQRYDTHGREVCTVEGRKAGMGKEDMGCCESEGQRSAREGGEG